MQTVEILFCYALFFTYMTTYLHEYLTYFTNVFSLYYFNEKTFDIYLIPCGIIRTGSLGNS